MFELVMSKVTFREGKIEKENDYKIVIQHQHHMYELEYSNGLPFMRVLNKNGV
ncbi:hypothetical protein [Virgibacillus halodenitrificans]|uniref:hypothetical protein n=1 Tax=Virgibacillus halodenitrificans TaxID=1482 RepID=UPI001F1BB802|nr:hypothetical protein [Virgibacillus halodenitrificans]